MLASTLHSLSPDYTPTLKTLVGFQQVKATHRRAIYDATCKFLRDAHLIDVFVPTPFNNIIDFINQ